jgi:hypothetical protein
VCSGQPFGNELDFTQTIYRLTNFSGRARHPPSKKWVLFSVVRLCVWRSSME